MAPRTPVKKKAKTSQAPQEQGKKKRKVSEMSVADRLEHGEFGEVSLGRRSGVAATRTRCTS